ncbi:TPA: SP_0009 family protein [Streptococcus suis]|nr:SP_0009 family protein [Streptococcus suis]
MTEDLLKNVELFLSYSDDKLEELTEKNQQLKMSVDPQQEISK